MLTFKFQENWVLSTLLTTCLIGLLFIALNISVDFYGLFNSADKRDRVAYVNERTSKYLFGLRYIPENFNGLLLGSSITSNWDTSVIQQYSTYNLSISGGNISEQKLIFDNVVSRGEIDLLVICIHPYLTASSGPKSGFMRPDEYWGSLGSIGLFKEYFSWALGSRPLINGFGKQDFSHDGNKKMLRSDFTLSRYKSVMDLRGWQDYREILDIARSKNIRIIGFIPPIFSEVYSFSAMEYDNYFSDMKKLFRENEPVLDFNSDSYAEIASDFSNFYDGTHLDETVSLTLSKELDKFIQLAR